MKTFSDDISLYGTNIVEMFVNKLYIVFCNLCEKLLLISENFLGISFLFVKIVCLEQNTCLSNKQHFIVVLEICISKFKFLN